MRCIILSATDEQTVTAAAGGRTGSESLMQSRWL